MKKQVLLIGVGGTGSRAIDILSAKIDKLGNQTDSTVTKIVFDTDERDVAKIQNAYALPLVDARHLDTICNDLDKKTLEDWFPCYDDKTAAKNNMVPITPYSNQDLLSGASQWRKKSYLAFVALMHDDVRRMRFENALRTVGANNSSCEVYIVASIAGGTGSGSFIPLALYAKKFLTETCGVTNVGVTALLACPDIYLDALDRDDEKIKVQANAYAILRELNAMNMTAFGHNSREGNGPRHSPIHFRLGHKDDTVIRVLFDSDEENYQNPKAVPFKKIYLFDRINGLNSVAAHDSVMASALYSLICTNVGLAFNGRDNNALPDIVTNPNSIFASMSAFEVEYPIDSIMEYISHMKAIKAVEGSWLHIYEIVERKIAALRDQARKKGGRFNFTPSLYSDLINTTVDGEFRTPTSSPALRLIMNSGLYNFYSRKGEDGKVYEDKEDRISLYIEKIDQYLREALDCTAASSLKSALNSDHKNYQKDIESAGLFASRTTKANKRKEFMKRVETNYRNLEGYYINAVTEILDRQMELLDAILPTNPKISPIANKELSFVYNLLTRNGQFLHPVAAYIVLAKVYSILEKKIEGVTRWADIDKGEPEKCVLPAEFLTSSPADEDSSAAYVFAATATSKKLRDEYAAGNFDPSEDSRRHRQDLEASFKTLSDAAEAQFNYAIWAPVLETVSKLLDSYRSFFKAFTEGKEDLIQKTADLRIADELVQEKMIIGAAGDDKDRAFAKFDENYSENDDTIDAMYDVCGKSVFTLNFGGITGAEDLLTIDSLFNAIVDSYREQAYQSAFYKENSQKSALQVIVEYFKEVRGMKSDKAIQEVSLLFNEARMKAAPPLHLTKKAQDNTIVMFHRANAEYLKKNETLFGIKHFDNPEHSALEFIKKLAMPSTEIEIADNTPPGTIYISRKIDTIAPTDIEKLNEIGDNPKYFRNYEIALKKRITPEGGINDMWNPHLGMNLHKHGYLPYINPKMEEIYDEKLAKAILFTLMKGSITYRVYSQRGGATEYSFSTTLNGKDEIIMFNGERATEDSFSNLICWFRQHDDLVEKRAEDFDREVEKELEALPQLISYDTQDLTAAITTSKVITFLRENLFTAVHGAAERRGLSLSLIEFAYRVKLSEESKKRDFDDAEKILKVGFNVIRKFCDHRLPDINEMKANIYNQQLNKFLGEFLADDDTNSFRQQESYVRAVIEWMNSKECFKKMNDYDCTFEAVTADQIRKTDEYKRAENERKLRNVPKKEKAATALPQTPTDTPTDDTTDVVTE